ncbi:unnamed protein product [Acanthoscelides obtectus]|uniref:Uncharacterized protein n=1 Tax=Acanthoscelides obtectus TaxID=200917 RepID=A0A9P0PB14_ACAOB|nr:unnamed protein product [Acanthoscelides obtectus]CAK1656522.1 hypothetical protein AOBTE_LOCUS19764 [Acanthoscelides obtectus]
MRSPESRLARRRNRSRRSPRRRKVSNHHGSKRTRRYSSSCSSSSIDVSENISKRNSQHHQLGSSSSEGELMKQRSRNHESNQASSTSMLTSFLDMMKGIKGRDVKSPPLNNVIPEFDPLCKEQAIDAWLHKVKECAQIYDWGDRQTIMLFLSCVVLPSLGIGVNLLCFLAGLNGRLSFKNHFPLGTTILIC